MRDARDKVNVLEDRDGKTYYDGPLVVLVNRYSASASEILPRHYKIMVEH